MRLTSMAGQLRVHVSKPNTSEYFKSNTMILHKEKFEEYIKAEGVG